MRRRTTTVLLAVVLTAGAGPARAADPVRTAEQEVATVQAEVERTAARLTAGTRELERSRAVLADVRERRDAAEQEAAQATAQATAARDRLQRVVAAAYRSPVPDAFVLALSGPQAFAAAVRAQADVQRVRASSGDLLREATAARVRARTATRGAEQLEQEATTRARSVERQLADLSRAARDAQRRLSASTGRLRAARLRAVASTGATCRGGSAGGANGFLPPSSLCPLAGAPGQALRADAAADFDRLTAASLAERGTPLCVTDSYRSYAGQVSVFARKPSLAAVPGTSRHGLGTALDLGCGVERFGSPAYRWMKANGPRFGWVHPAWAEPGGSMPEPWHWEHTG